MELYKLSDIFFEQNKHLTNALDNYNGSWDLNKTRGYGIVIITFKTLKFAIPLRSRLIHTGAYITEKKSNHNPNNKGFDFSQALLISNDAYVSNQKFKINYQTHVKLIGKHDIIAKKLQKYINKYINAIEKNQITILRDLKYRHTTLVNYHKELGINN